MEKNIGVEDFISTIHEDLMEIYNVSDEEATDLINEFGVRTLIAKHGELVAHYPTKELAKMVYK